MGHDLTLHTLLLLGLLWLCVIVRWIWPRRRATMAQADSQPTTRTYRRSADPPPFPGLTIRPPCAACEQAAQAPIAEASFGPPALMTSARGRRRQVATQYQFCPRPCCQYYNWLQVLGGAETPHIDQGVRQQLHPIVPLLNVFKTEEQPLELVLPCKRPFHSIP